MRCASKPAFRGITVRFRAGFAVAGSGWCSTPQYEHTQRWQQGADSHERAATYGRAGNRTPDWHNRHCADEHAGTGSSGGGDAHRTTASNAHVHLYTCSARGHSGCIRSANFCSDESSGSNRPLVTDTGGTLALGPLAA